MVVHKRKKVTKYRGSKTHGGGAMKKRRGAGHRGGRGKAGTGKRAKTKKPSILQVYGNNYLGKHGFKRPAKVLITKNCININQLETKFDSWFKQGKIKKDGDAYKVHLTELGYGKLLGSGKIVNKWDIIISSASQAAIKKVESKNGKVTTEKEDSDEKVEE